MKKKAAKDFDSGADYRRLIEGYEDPKGEQFGKVDIINLTVSIIAIILSLIALLI